MRWPFLLLFGAGIAGAADQAPPKLETVDARVAEGRDFSAQLGGELKAALSAAIADDGPLGAIDVCRVEAPAIAARVSRPGVVAGRTALRVRNPANAPDAGERAVLEDFARRLAAGEKVETIEDFRATAHGSRYMRAIVTQPMCTTCHGVVIAPDLQRAISRRYPEDQAVGFEPGSLRGAFVVEWQDAARP